MKVTDHVQISSLLFSFLTHETRNLAIIEFIKIKEFSKHQRIIKSGVDLILHSLYFTIHKQRNQWFACYEYTTDPRESVYDPPILTIHIHVPIYTCICVVYHSSEEATAPPPGLERRVIIKPKKPKKQCGSEGGKRQHLNLSVYTAYCER